MIDFLYLLVVITSVSNENFIKSQDYHKNSKICIKVIFYHQIVLLKCLDKYNVFNINYDISIPWIWLNLR